MSALSTFESRTGKLNYPSEEIYYFVTDFRNFKRFIPQNSISNLKVEKDSCSFQVSMLGTVKIYIRERVMYNNVVFSGNALQVNDFSVIMNLNDTGYRNSEAKITLIAEMNPMLKMAAVEPVKKFLEKLIDEMEKFSDWKNTTTDN
jgi:carbon monoxide dehydrogenase subunit G